MEMDRDLSSVNAVDSESEGRGPTPAVQRPVRGFSGTTGRQAP